MKQLLGLLLFQIFANNFANVNSEMQNNNANDREPVFSQPIKNVSVSLGREAVLTCFVSNLQGYKVGWMRSADQTVLALQGRVVTHNSRYSVNNEEMKVWRLKISNIRESDRGCYMCQINTTPLKKQIGCLDVNLPPDILDTDSSKDITVMEGQNATLYCAASGNPKPRIIWRRDDGNQIITKINNKTRRSDTVEGELLSLLNIDRRQIGAYMCIAKNDVPPAKSKMIHLNVNFAPNVTILNEKSVHVLEHSHVDVECAIEASPKAVSYWIKEPLGRSFQQSYQHQQNVLQEGDKYNMSESINAYYKTILRMRISNFNENDVGIYTCMASNMMGRANSTIRLFEIKIPTTSTTTTLQPTTTTTRMTTTMRTSTRRTTTRRATTTTTAEATTEEMSTEPQFEFITFNPEFNNEVPSGSDSYLNRPQLNVAYSTSRAAECSFHNVWVIAIMSLTKLLIMAR